MTEEMRGAESEGSGLASKQLDAMTAAHHPADRVTACAPCRSVNVGVLS